MKMTSIFKVLWRPTNQVKDAVYANIVGEQAYEVNLCQQCERITFGRQLRDLSVELYGIQIMGFVWPDDASLIISDDLAQHLSKYDLKGSEIRPVQVKAWWRPDPITGKDVNWLEDHQAPKLFQVVVRGKGGHISTTDVRVLSSCNSCGAKDYSPIKSIRIDPSQWDGSDIFNVEELPNYILVTDKFVNALNDYGPPNYSVVDSELLKTD